MEAIIFCGIQASGKTTFYSHHFLQTHLRISMDLLRTRHREKKFLDLCLQAGQRFVIDNTNPTAEERRRYIEPALAARFRLTGFYFETSMGEAIRRNAGRTGKARIPAKGIGGTRKRLEVPLLSEGFERLYKVQLQPNNFFSVEELYQ
ncbi:AAA family ATPase [Nafulsella turpanensis]|uniref:AAA family ATPase n=1 Tax=Nafulsella turpanensis TaxID=1265690 RepID=UPI000348A1B1|nr:AAA family ATPase [Nafulsella turpanensis]